jgi:hypothetical protein
VAACEQRALFGQRPGGSFRKPCRQLQQVLQAGLLARRVAPAIRAKLEARVGFIERRRLLLYQLTTKPPRSSWAKVLRSGDHPNHAYKRGIERVIKHQPQIE